MSATCHQCFLFQPLPLLLLFQLPFHLEPLAFTHDFFTKPLLPPFTEPWGF